MDEELRTDLAWMWRDGGATDLESAAVGARTTLEVIVQMACGEGSYDELRRPARPSKSTAAGSRRVKDDFVLALFAAGGAFQVLGVYFTARDVQEIRRTPASQTLGAAVDDVDQSAGRESHASGAQASGPARAYRGWQRCGGVPRRTRHYVLHTGTAGQDGADG